MPARNGRQSRRGQRIGKKDHYKRTPKRGRGQLHAKKEAKA